VIGLIWENILSQKEKISDALSDISSGIHLVDDEGRTALHYACEIEDLSIVIPLLESGIMNVRAKTLNGQTALDIAKEKKNQSIIDSIQKFDTSFFFFFFFF